MNEERILIVHSVAGTNPSEMAMVKKAIKAFRRRDSSVRAILRYASTTGYYLAALQAAYCLLLLPNSE